MKDKIWQILLFFSMASVLLSCGPSEEKPLERFEARYIYSDGTERYRFPAEPGKNEPVTVRIRVKSHSTDTVRLITNQSETDMLLSSSDGVFDYFVADIQSGIEPVNYYFQVAQGNKSVFYSRRGIEMSPPGNSFKFKIFPGYTVPPWMRGAVLYQIFIDRFHNGDPSNDVMTNEYMYDNFPSIEVEDWNKFPDGSTKYSEGSNRTREFYGGDLEGVIQKLDYLQELGIDGIYFNPLFVSPSNHKYDAQDYSYIDPHVGTIVNDGGALINPEDDPNYKNPQMSHASAVNQYAERYIKRTTDRENLEASNDKLKELIDEAEKRGIKIILDGVFNHSGSFNKWLDREHIYEEDGAYESPDSPYVNYYSFSKDNWPDNESYEAWWGYKTLPKLNFEGDQALEDTIMDMIAKWVEFGVEGWRIDVAADLGHSTAYNHEFYRIMRERVKEVNPEAVILAEIYGDSSAWLRGDEWDTVMNYDAFFEPLSFYFTGMEKHSYYYREELKNNSRNFEQDLREKMAKMPWNSMEIAMNQLDNHDHSRFLSRTSGFVDEQKSSTDTSTPELADKNLNKGIMKEAAVMQMTMPGAPTLYYGNEAGLAGFTDPDSRRTYPWGNEDQEMLSFYKEIISIRKEYSSLRDGSLLSLKFDQPGIFSYGRWNNENKVIVTLNNNETEQVVSIPLWSMNISEKEKLKLIFRSDRDSHSRPDERLRINNGNLIVTVPAFGTVIALSEEGSSAGEITDSTETLRPKIKRITSSKGEGEPLIVVEFTKEMYQRDISEAFSITPFIEGTFAWNGKRVGFFPKESVPSGTYTVSIVNCMRAIEGSLYLKEGKTEEIQVK
ncbi:MAG: glycoside hydrolase family 13 protein [Spirochaetaceae bacterium]|nr:glycoside hydrolase family 13 protein [Spirochaetaceae bacterium]